MFSFETLDDDELHRFVEYCANPRLQEAAVRELIERICKSPKPVYCWYGPL